MIDTQSAPGAWAETLASPSCKIEVLHTHTTKVGALDVNFTFGRIAKKSRNSNTGPQHSTGAG